MNKTKNSINNATNQTTIVLSMLKRYRRSKLTTEQITNLVNESFNTKLTTRQISKCLNRLSVRNIVSIADRNGSTTYTNYAARWQYMPVNTK